VGADLYYPDGSRNECQIGRYSTGQITTTFAYKFRRLFLRVPPLHRRLMRAWYTYNWDHERTTESAMIWNACMMFRREVLEAIGPFDEQFFVWYADVDWCYRAAAAGWKAYYLKGAGVIHYEKQSGDYLESDAVRYKVNWAAARSRMNRDKYAMLAKHHSTMLLRYTKATDSVLLGVSQMEAAAARLRSAGAPA
jgi:GT2 family glycosyltransferase